MCRCEGSLQAASLGGGYSLDSGGVFSVGSSYVVVSTKRGCEASGRGCPDASSLCSLAPGIAPWGKRGWKMFHTMLRGMVLYFLKVLSEACLCQAMRGAGRRPTMGRWPALMFAFVLCGRERTTVPKERTWSGSWWTSQWECTTPWPPRPPITPRSPTSFSYGRLTGASTSSRPRECRVGRCSWRFSLPLCCSLISVGC